MQLLFFKGKPKTVTKRKRNVKQMGSCKTGIGCTSQIKVVIGENGKYTVMYSKRHYGHSNEVQHLHLPKEVRGETAKKLSQGITVTK